jgi:hypothetical protein
LAGKQVFWLKEKTLYFAFFHVFMVFCDCKGLSISGLGKMGAFKKNRAEKPTVGFWFWEGSGNIVA